MTMFKRNKVKYIYYLIKIIMTSFKRINKFKRRRIRFQKRIIIVMLTRKKLKVFACNAIDKNQFMKIQQFANFVLIEYSKLPNDMMGKN